MLSADTIEVGGWLLDSPLWLLALALLWPLPQLWRRWRPAGVGSSSPSPSPSSVTALHPLIHILPSQPHESAVGSRSSPAARWQARLRWLGLVALVLALAEPVRIGERLPEPPPQRDVLFIVDSSIAMVLRDYRLDGQPIDRMSMLKALLTRVVERLQGERMGVIVFGERAYTLVPPSPDPALVAAMVARLRTTLAGRFSASGEAVALAVREALAADGTESENAALAEIRSGDLGSPRHQVLVMLSAAGTPTGSVDLRAAAELAREHGLPLHTIVIGASPPSADADASPVAASSSHGGSDSGLIYRPADVALLQAVAKLSGGLSFTATDSAAIEQALLAIEASGSRPPPAAVSHLRQPLYLWSLLIAVLLLALAEWLPSPRPQAVGETGG